MHIRRDKLDTLFSQYIKLRDKYCQRCGGNQGLQTAHFIGRANHAVRYDNENACLLDYGCHQYFHANPLEFVEYFKTRLGEEAFDLLNARARCIQKVDRKLVEIYLNAKIKELEE